MGPIIALLCLALVTSGLAETADLPTKEQQDGGKLSCASKFFVGFTCDRMIDTNQNLKHVDKRIGEISQCFKGADKGTIESYYLVYAAYHLRLKVELHSLAQRLVRRLKDSQVMDDLERQIAERANAPGCFKLPTNFNELTQQDELDDDAELGDTKALDADYEGPDLMIGAELDFKTKEKNLEISLKGQIEREVNQLALAIIAGYLKAPITGAVLSIGLRLKEKLIGHVQNSLESSLELAFGKSIVSKIFESREEGKKNAAISKAIEIIMRSPEELHKVAPTC